MSIDQGWVPQACALPTGEQPLRSAEFDDLFATALLTNSGGWAPAGCSGVWSRRPRGPRGT